MTWTTNEASDSRVEYGTSAERAHARRRSDSAAVTAHSVQLTGADPGHDVPLPGSLRRRRAQRALRSGHDERARDVPRAGQRDRHAGVGDAETGTLRGRHRRRADRRRQRLLPGQLDDERHPHDLVLRLVHRRAGGHQLALGQLPRAQLVAPARRSSRSGAGPTARGSSCTRPRSGTRRRRARTSSRRARRATTSARPARCGCSVRCTTTRRASSPRASSMQLTYVTPWGGAEPGGARPPGAAGP